MPQSGPVPSGTASGRSELRVCPLRGSMVIVAPERAARPIPAAPPPAPSEDVAQACPFCDATALAERALLVTPAPGGDVLVVPNRYPATEAHEVVIETPRHQATLVDLGRGQVAAVLSAWQARLRSHLRDTAPDGWAIAFRNSGGPAGSSLPHPHSQVLSLPLAPPAIAAEHERATAWRRAQGVRLQRTLVERAAAEGRVVASHAGGALLAWCPWAASQAWETWITPRDGARAFLDLDQPALEHVAALLVDVLERFEAAGAPAAHNLALHLEPAARATPRASSWRLEITPRESRPGGFELASGVQINALPPEAAAARLRDA